MGWKEDELARSAAVDRARRQAEAQEANRVAAQRRAQIRQRTKEINRKG